MAYDPQGLERVEVSTAEQGYAEADRLGYPVLVNGEFFEKKAAAMKAIEAAVKSGGGGKVVLIARPGPALIVKK